MYLYYVVKQQTKKRQKMKTTNESEGMKFNPLTNLGLAEAYSSIMNEHVKEMLACNDDTLPELIASMQTTYTDEFIVECVRVSEYIRRKIYK